jgi:hypothetical protein
MAKRAARLIPFQQNLVIWQGKAQKNDEDKLTLFQALSDAQKNNELLQAKLKNAEAKFMQAEEELANSEPKIE